jgi:predicted RNA binding protein YcfA (HicA-like mRNA interferase family)
MEVYGHHHDLEQRDLAGTELAALLRRYGYEQTRQTGSHMRLTSRLNTLFG